MTKITLVSKKALSLIFAMLIACSCMAIASAETASSVNKITLTANDCYFVNDDFGKHIKVANKTVTVNDELCNITYTATEKGKETTLTSTQDVEKNLTVFALPLSASNVTYVITGVVRINDVAVEAVEPYEITIKNSQTAPAAPVPVSLTSTSIEITAVAGCEYKIDDGKWQSGTKFTGLTPEKSYKISIRYKETDTAYASSVAYATVTTLKAASTNPTQQPSLIDKTKTMITVGVLNESGEVDPNYEYSIDGGKTWQKSGVFNGLKANSLYTFVARESFDAQKQDPSATGDPINITTNLLDPFAASLEKCTFKITSQPHEDGIYAGDTVGFTVTGDTRANANDVQYGDTRYVPVKFKATQDKTSETALSSGSGTITTTGKAKVTVTVIYEKQRFDGEWETVGSDSRTFSFEVKEEYNGVKKFFEKFLNILLDTVPGILAKLLEMDLLGKLIGLITGK